MEKQYTLRDLRAACKKLHVELDTDRIGDYAIYSPRGYRFGCTGAHVCVATHRDVKEWKLWAVQSLMADLSYGLEKCPKNCECKE